MIAALRKFRPNVGTAPQEFVQRAAVAAWGDEEHVERNRARYGRKRALLRRPVRAQGVVASPAVAATMYLWVATSRRRDVGGVRRRGCSSTAWSSLPGRTSARRARATSGSRSCRPRTSAPRRSPFSRARSEPQAEIEELWADLDPARAGAVEETIAALDRGELRVAEKHGDEWVVHEWAKKAILLYFRLRKVAPVELGPFEYLDKVPLKRDYAERGVRVVPPATARYGSFLSDGVVLMPSYVNIGAWVGPRTMVDTWATVGSCAQIGADVHLAGGVGIGGVLEPLQAQPGDRRGRRVHRLALHRHRGRRSWARRRARRERRADRVDARSST